MNAPTAATAAPVMTTRQKTTTTGWTRVSIARNTGMVPQVVAATMIRSRPEAES